MTCRLRAVPQTTKTPSSETPISASGGIRKSFNPKYFQVNSSSPLSQEVLGTAAASACPFLAHRPGASPLRALCLPAGSQTDPPGTFSFPPKAPIVRISPSETPSVTSTARAVA